jgi:protein-S-isoprenylcysteine O-methyltransferase Ste14
MKQVADHAGVVIPPPLIFLVPFLVGAVLERRWPWPIALDAAAALDVMGVGALAFGFALGLTAAHTFRKHGTTVLPARRPTTAIARTGPYRFTRNPMYVGMALAYIGGALLLGSWWPLTLLPAVLLAVDRYVIAREERYLRAKFGDDYTAYTRRVRRWF